jgi:SAM-dependent methyltransferase
MSLLQKDSALNHGSVAVSHSPDDGCRYVLATGQAAHHRLQILQALYGPGTRRLLLAAGLRRGMRVADLGCGVGTVTAELAQLVGHDGSVVGVDVSAAQLEQAREQLRLRRLASPLRATQVSFDQASAIDTRLPSESFDMVYCRFLLLHLPQPRRALAEMHRLLKPGGVLVCEDGDLTSAGSQPPSALGAFADLFGRLGRMRGVDYTLGSRLYHMVLDAGFPGPQITFNQPVRSRGDEKRLLELSVAEAAGAIVESGLLTADELARTLGEMRRLADDERVLAVMPRMAQVWARKPAADT